MIRGPVIRVSTASSLPMLGRIGEAVLGSREGDVIFGHILLPHHPYIFDSRCRPNPNVEDWLSAGDPAAHPMRNTAASRRKRYERYFEQVQCSARKLEGLFAAMKEAGVWENTRILLHGDHGSRIGLAHPQEIPAGDPRADAVRADAFSTLLAVKDPGITPGEDPRLVSLSEFFDRWVRRQPMQDAAGWALSPYVYLVRKTAKREPMPRIQNLIGDPRGRGTMPPSRIER